MFQENPAHFIPPTKQFTPSKTRAEREKKREKQLPDRSLPINMIGDSSSSSSSSDSSSCGNSRSRRRRCVHFPQEEEDLATVLLTIESVDDLSQELKKDLWFSRSDNQFSRSSARVIAKESERYGHSKHLDHVYFSTVRQEAQDKLNLWALHGSSRRGLERWANSSHGNLRKEDQYVYINGIIRAQTELKLKDTPPDILMERLQEVGAKLSVKSRLFAEMLGAADAQAARWEFGITEVREAPPLSPRQCLLQAAATPSAPKGRKNLGLGSSSGLASRKTAPSRRSFPNTARSNSLANITSPGGGGRRRVSATSIPPPATSTSTRVSPRISIRTRPARVPRMA